MIEKTIVCNCLEILEISLKQTVGELVGVVWCLSKVSLLGLL